jgi:hypothetical protein
MKVDLPENNAQVHFLIKGVLDGDEEQAINMVYEVFLDIICTSRESNKQLMKLEKINRRFNGDPKYIAIAAKLREYWTV